MRRNFSSLSKIVEKEKANHYKGTLSLLKDLTEVVYSSGDLDYIDSFRGVVLDLNERVLAREDLGDYGVIEKVKEVVESPIVKKEAKKKGGPKGPRYLDKSESIDLYMDLVGDDELARHSVAMRLSHAARNDSIRTKSDDNGNVSHYNVRDINSFVSDSI